MFYLQEAWQVAWRILAAGGILVVFWFVMCLNSEHPQCLRLTNWFRRMIAWFSRRTPEWLRGSPS